MTLRNLVSYSKPSKREPTANSIAHHEGPIYASVHVTYTFQENPIIYRYNPSNPNKLFSGNGADSSQPYFKPHALGS
ncbi:hypothetical protein DSO57_1021199 [Entomophthora muscae]|uniref:Uncharacterized protein n=1 Tax=Entomophthora muscae TaxID=34485 RepID=A0ACC2U1I1_9FUNG|nr:hypothetical protein DSO57_1021199 [Entomophthora muscae]